MAANLKLGSHGAEMLNVPLIDLGCLNQHNTTLRSLVIEDIRSACQTHGCFQVINHGIGNSVIAGALETASDFFHLPDEKKAELASGDITKPVRYSAGNPRSFLKQYANPLNDWAHFWPLTPIDYREKMGTYAVEARRVALQLTNAILESLGLGEAYLAEKLEAGVHVLIVNSYQQPSDSPESMLGFRAHSDYGFVTIQIQSYQGLQVIDRGAGTWASLPDIPGALHVHIGDYMEVLSNGQYKTAVHRAVLDTCQRISIASIHSLSMDEMVITPVELVDKEHPKGYRDNSFRDFLNYSVTNDFINGNSFMESLRIAAT